MEGQVVASAIRICVAVVPALCVGMVGWVTCAAMIPSAATLLLSLSGLCTVLIAQQVEPVRALLVTGANNHDWKWTAPQIAGALAETGRFAVTVTDQPASALASETLAADYSLIVLDYNGPRWGQAAEAGFLRAVEQGTGVVVIHAANNAFDGWTEYERLVGLCWRKGTGHGRYHPFDVVIVDRSHPITRDMEDLHMHPDELYHRLMVMPGADYKVLLSAYSDPRTGGTNRHEPMVTVSRYGKGRVFHTPLGHTWNNNIPSRATWFDPQLRRLVARGAEWAATGEVTLAARPWNYLSQQEREEGFELLFDGRTLDGWRGYRQEGPPEQGWRVDDGAIFHAKGGGGGDLITDAQFGDFDFRFSWRVGARGNSGVIWHVLETADATYMTGPEYQVLDDQALQPDPRHGAGALYDLVGNEKAVTRPAGAWNEGRIVIQNGRVQHWLNGVKLLDVACAGTEWEQRVAASKFRDWPFGKSASGHLALQDHGDEVAYRDLRIRRL